MGRPLASSRSVIEAAAMRLFLERGYGATSVEAIADECGVSRATFFRYFTTKAAVVWGEFDLTIERLRARLSADPGEPWVEAIRAAVVETTRAAAENPTWIDRFRLMDVDPELRRGVVDHWSAWEGEIAALVEARTGLPRDGVVASAVSGAFQAAYVAVLRGFDPAEAAEVEGLMADMHDAFAPLLTPFALLVGDPPQR